MFHNDTRSPITQNIRSTFQRRFHHLNKVSYSLNGFLCYTANNVYSCLMRGYTSVSKVGLGMRYSKSRSLYCTVERTFQYFCITVVIMHVSDHVVVNTGTEVVYIVRRDLVDHFVDPFFEVGLFLPLRSLSVIVLLQGPPGQFNSKTCNLTIVLGVK